MDCVACITCVARGDGCNRLRDRRLKGCRNPLCAMVVDLMVDWVTGSGLAGPTCEIWQSLQECY